MCCDADIAVEAGAFHQREETPRGPIGPTELYHQHQHCCHGNTITAFDWAALWRVSRDLAPPSRLFVFVQLLLPFKLHQCYIEHERVLLMRAIVKLSHECISLGIVIVRLPVLLMIFFYLLLFDDCDWQLCLNISHQSSDAHMRLSMLLSSSNLCHLIARVPEPKSLRLWESFQSTDHCITNVILLFNPSCTSWTAFQPQTHSAGVLSHCKKMFSYLGILSCLLIQISKHTLIKIHMLTKQNILYT